VREIELAGARTNLVGLINDFANRILAAVNRGATAPAWNPADEANQYFQEAQWALRCGAWREAQAASEASWALGRQVKDVEKLRVKAYLEGAGDLGGCSVDWVSKFVSFSPPAAPVIRDARQAGSFVILPEAERFSQVARALELYYEGTLRFALPEPKLDAEWLALGVRVMERCSSWLRYFYFSTEAREGQQERIAAARKLCLESFAALERHPSFSQVDTNSTLIAVVGRHGAFWVEKPEQGVALYQQFVESGQWPMIRTRFQNQTYVDRRWSRFAGMPRTTGGPPGAGADPASPCLAGWNWADRKRCPAVWSGFVEGLCAATNR